MEANILSYGAIGDGKTINTKAIQSAIDAVSQAGGGRVTIPAGCFVSGTIWLKDYVELHLESGAVLKASADFADYNAEDAYPQNFGSINEGWCGCHLLIAHRKKNVSITGFGKINGSGNAFTEEPHPMEEFAYIWAYGFAREKDKEKRRPGQMLCFVECEHVRVLDVTMENAPAWTCFFHGCSCVTIRGIHIFNERYAANTDGLDIDTCRYVTISDCLIDTGDDAIAIRCDAARLQNGMTTCEHVTIANCVLASSSSVVRLGVGIGEIRHVVISNITIPRGGIAFNLITSYSARGRALLSDILVENVIAENVGYPIRLQERNQAFIRHVVFRGLRFKTFSCLSMIAESTGAVSDITVKDVEMEIVPPPFLPCKIAAEQHGDVPVYLYRAARVRFENVRVNIPQALAHEWKDMTYIAECADIQRIDCNF
ncbi:MAG: hypothetical protein J6D31_07205 [Clostridia bacterium]|nr:hypothetical protein [Clostridia bacterium]